MKITTIEYRETVSFGDYQNITVGMTAEVGPFENVQHAVDRLADIVKEDARRLVAEREQDRSSEFKRGIVLATAQRDLDDILRDIQSAKERWEKIVAFLEKFGVDVSDMTLPF